MSLWDSIGGFFGDPVGGLLDFRQTLINQRNDLLNPLVQATQSQRGIEAADQTRWALGDTGEGMHSEDGFYTDLGPARGLLADPRFADNKRELAFGANLLKSPATSRLGENILSNVIAAQQQVDVSQAANQGSAYQQLIKDAQAQQNKNRDVALAIQDDVRREIGPVASQIPTLEGLYATLASGSASDAIATIFQFMQSIEPGGIVRDTEQDMVKGIGGIYTELANYLNAVQGKGLDSNLRKQLAATVTRIVAPRIKDAQMRMAQFKESAELSALGNYTELATKGFGSLTMPELPAGLRAPTPPPGVIPPNPNDPKGIPPGFKPGRRPRD